MKTRLGIQNRKKSVFPEDMLIANDQIITRKNSRVAGIKFISLPWRLFFWKQSDVVWVL